RSNVEEDQEIADALPVKPGENVRYFVMKSLSHDNLAQSVREGRWRTRRLAATRMNESFAVCDQVIVVFSVNESRRVSQPHFQGCARMTTPTNRDARAGGADLWDAVFGVGWLRLCELPFRNVGHLKNPLNEDLPVLRSRDGQELVPDIGRRLLMHLYR
ncbi:unnamed protein product, partial [Phaeothamnion confervicola]